MSLESRLTKLEQQTGVRKNLPEEILVHPGHLGEETYLCYGLPWELLKVINLKTYELFDHKEFVAKYLYQFKYKPLDIFRFSVLWSEEDKKIPNCYIDQLVGSYAIQYYLNMLSEKEKGLSNELRITS